MGFSYADKIIIKHYCETYKWSYVETAIHKHRNVDDFEQLKREIVRAWNAIPQEVVDNAIDAFRKRLRCCIKVNGGHIEHYKKNF